MKKIRSDLEERKISKGLPIDRKPWKSFLKNHQTQANMENRLSWNMIMKMIITTEGFFEAAVKVGLGRNWAHDHWILLRCSNQLSYKTMSSTQLHSEPTLYAHSDLNPCSVSDFILAIAFGICYICFTQNFVEVILWV